MPSVSTPPPGGRPRRPRLPAGPNPGTSTRRRLFQGLLVFVTMVLVINGLIGEKGLMETTRARRQYRELAGSIERLRAENAALWIRARRLREDPAAIESLAREELGLIRPGEVLFIIRDARPTPDSQKP